MIMRYTYLLLILLILNVRTGAQPGFLRSSLEEAREVQTELSSEKTHYKPLFGKDVNGSDIVKGVKRYGYLSIDSGGSTGIVRYDEEQIFFVLEGTGTVYYGKEEIPVSKNDFIYFPVGMKHGISNPREKALNVIIMGYELQPESAVKPSGKMMIANTDEVSFQVLGGHGPTTQFQLLLGTTESTRDRLAAASQVTSLFIMDFDAGGTNIPHQHKDAEEIYLVLRGTGEMVAGKTPEGKEMRHPVKPGDAFFFPPNTLIGFYSGTREGEEHARILAVRSTYPIR